jgi:hypothetical protein
MIDRLNDMAFLAEDVAKLSTMRKLLISLRKDPYIDSPFLPLKRLSSRKKGARMEEIAEDILKGYNQMVSRSGNSNWDRTINGHKVEIKGSFIWDVTNRFNWQQIRQSQEYDYLLFMAFYPDRLEMYVASKETAMKYLAVQDELGMWTHNQHGGKNVETADTFALRGMPEDFPWLTPIHLSPIFDPELQEYMLF